MTRTLALALCLTLASPALAEPEDGPGLMDRGIDLFLRGLMQEMEPELQEMGEALRAMEPQLRKLIDIAGDLKNYEAPERLPNGDIILRRKKDAAPLPPPASDAIEL